jgi:hypothetical protein
MMEKRTKNILLYIFSIPAGILATMLAGYVFELFMRNPNLVRSILKGFVMGFAGVYTVGYLSPKYKMNFMILFTILTISLLVYLFFISKIDISFSQKAEIITQTIATIMFTIFIRIDGLHTVYKK